MKAEKIKIKFSKFQFFFLPFLEILGGDSVKQLNKFVWPKVGIAKYICTVLQSPPRSCAVNENNTKVKI